MGPSIIAFGPYHKQNFQQLRANYAITLIVLCIPNILFQFYMFEVISECFQCFIGYPGK
jgi:hypothetical protein